MSEERKKGDAKERKKKSRQKKKERNDLSVSEIITALVEENSQFKHVNKH